MRPRALRVLVVDDDEAVCSALGAIVSSEQHTVAVSLSAREALALANQLKPDVAIVDVNMPGIGGADLSQLLRARFPELRIILHTGQDPNALGDKAKHAHLVIQKGSVLAFLAQFRAFVAE